MKKSLLLLLLCAGILTGCGNQALPAEPTETSTVSQTTSAVQAAEQSTTTTTTITEGIPEVTETCSEVISSVTTVTETNTATEEIPNDTESITTTASVQEEETPAVQSTTTKADNAESTVTTKVTVTTKATTSVKVTTTTKPVTTTKATTTTKVTTTTKATTTAPIQTTTTTTTTSAEDYYHEIGRNLSHDGTDYGKAKAVYDWMRANGHGTCVNYSYQTYLVCEGIGLECYCCWTDAGIYGHTANVVKVNGVWFVLDTQAGGFLDYNYGFTEVIDKYENHVADGSMISDYSYEELYG
ncbi:MAG: hypothetical protein IJ421_10765 [Prevotella sp.]|nr:hypothetical protein [Oscillospiraceae bacterium]MBQ8629938.1 hypothetical protein [Prevotella sp.]